MCDGSRCRRSPGAPWPTWPAAASAGRCATLLSVAALAAEACGDVIEVDPLSTVSEREEETLALLLDEAVAARLLDDDPDRPPRRRFRHALVREVLAHDLPAAERGRVHARVAEALESRACEPTAARLAHHWRRATGDGARERAATWSLRAARDAVAGFGFEAAVAQGPHSPSAAASPGSRCRSTTTSRPTSADRPTTCCRPARPACVPRSAPGCRWSRPAPRLHRRHRD